MFCIYQFVNTKKRFLRLCKILPIKAKNNLIPSLPNSSKSILNITTNACAILVNPINNKVAIDKYHDEI